MFLVVLKLRLVVLQLRSVPGCEKGSTGRNWLDCMRGKGVRYADLDVGRIRVADEERVVLVLENLWIWTTTLSIKNYLSGSLLFASFCQSVSFQGYRYRANMVHIRQSRPGSGLGFQVQVLESFKMFPLRSQAVRQFWSLGVIPGVAKETILY